MKILMEIVSGENFPADFLANYIAVIFKKFYVFYHFYSFIPLLLLLSNDRSEDSYISLADFFFKEKS